MRIAAAQIVTGEDTRTNLELVREWTRHAADAGAQVVVFPEATQRQFGHNLTSIAEPVDGPWADQVRQIAYDAGVVVVLGMFTPASPNDDGRERVTNTLLAVGTDSAGNRIDASYDKIHLYDAFGFLESDTVAPGEGLVRVDVDGVRIGLATCYDVRFPALFTAHARAGTHVTVLPASWGAGPGKVDQWRLLTRARALDSTQYIVACGQGNPAAAYAPAVDGAPTGVGHSAIVSPMGRVLAEAGEEPELLVVDLDLDAVETARRNVPVLENARQL
ncbi:MAG: carbon-nitrogen hydrolase family protein [Nesterenkonia sp.]|uniref:carbon-nitrogen hydrolase family protein n=1 Tax=Nesterenkonia marinintestina TaxID=2979865 RepID=UPI0021BED5B6|nr:carbon-nitrogen hydrolase family protein [Nesterenkonia sp. GX14115]MDO5493096.1 carbon-nitrogen hydrolase family protein [Nesterenkonia sp.]